MEAPNSTTEAGSLYSRIAAELRSQIIGGTLAEGARLPTEKELAARYEVSRNTVRLALGTLVNEGMITSTPRRGTFVRKHVAYTFKAQDAERPAGDRFDAYTREVLSQGRQPGQDLEVKVLPADAAIATRLNIEVGDTVVERTMFRRVDGRPWSLQRNYYPWDLAQLCDLITPQDIPEGVIRVLAEHGYPETAYHDDITTRMPSPEESRMLDIETGVPVLVLARTARAGNKAVRLSDTIFPGDRNRISYDL